MLATLDARSASDSEFNLMSIADLREALEKSQNDTAESILRSAKLLRELEERGEDLSDLKIGMMGYLRLIAYKQTVPALVVRFIEHPSLIRLLSRYPLPDQERLAAGANVKLIVHKNGDHRMVDPLEMDFDQIRQVFGHHSFRSDVEQILMLDGRVTQQTKQAGKLRVGMVHVDRERGGIKMGRVFAPVGNVVEALALLATDTPDEEDDGDKMEKLALPLRPAQLRKLKIKAAASGRDPRHMAIDALKIAGLI